jgi:hypothetical protein
MLFGKAQLSKIKCSHVKKTTRRGNRAFVRNAWGKERKLANVEVGGPFIVTSTEALLAYSGRLVVQKYQGHRKAPPLKARCRE